MPKTSSKKAVVKKDLHENCLKIEGLPEIMERVTQMMEEKEYNPGTIQDGEAGSVFIKGEAHMVLDEKYVPTEEAQLVFQARKVVREYLVLQKMLKSKK